MTEEFEFPIVLAALATTPVEALGSFNVVTTSVLCSLPAPATRTPSHRGWV
jgi:hypothetical protein